jgi:L-glyceraldehyde 3-phosphate reductase
MFNRSIEDGLLPVLREEGIGCIVFSPLAQGLLTDKYLHGIPQDSRAANPQGALQREQITDAKVRNVRQLHEVAQAREQTLAQLALTWVLRHEEITSALIGASRSKQIEDAVHALEHVAFTADELHTINQILAG